MKNTIVPMSGFVSLTRFFLTIWLTIVDLWMLSSWLQPILTYEKIRTKNTLAMYLVPSGLEEYL